MSVVGIGTPKRVTGSGAITPPQVNIVERIILAGGATGPVVNLRDGSSASGNILCTIGAPTNTTVFGDVGIQFNGGCYVEVVSGNATVTLVMS